MLSPVGDGVQKEFSLTKACRLGQQLRSGEMKAMKSLAAFARRQTVKVNRLILLLVLCLAVSTALRAQDPLNPANMPVIDTTCTDYPSNVWVTSSLVKVYQNAGTPPGCSSGQQQWITVYGTQNEIVDFQIHFHDTGAGTSGYQVTVSSFTQSSPGSFTIASPSASARDIVVYAEAYINVTSSSAGGQGSTPSYNWIMIPTGEIPDILVPAIDPYYHQTTNAFPINVGAGNNQSAWVDIHIPTTALSGYYKGTVTVQKGCTGPYPSSGCSTVTTLPIVLAVWQWPGGGYMPSTATLQSYHIIGDGSACGAFYNTAYGAGCNAWPGSGGSATMAAELSKIDFGNLYLDHRLSGPNTIYPPPESGSFSNFETYFGPLMNGTSNTILPGAKVTALQYVSGSTFQQWTTEFQSKGWLSTLFNYSCDEPPNGCAWATIYSNAQNLHAANPGMAALVTTSFSRMTPSVETAACGSSTCLDNSVDWMVVNIIDMDKSAGGITRANYNTWLAGSSNIGNPPTRRLWSYQACDSTGCGSGAVGSNASSYAIDVTPVSHRAMEWDTFLNQQQGELYFNDTICWGVCASNNGDPWQGVNYNGTNGDGTLIYPGRQIGTPTGFSNVGVTNPILLPSVRLKDIRDGMQDYEYLNVLSNNGKGSVATAAINSWITSPGLPFNNTLAPVPSAYTSDLPDARYTLGTAMHQLTYPPVLLPPPSLTGALQTVP
jgi:hypothetical protein